jgi:hypothetical protein
VKEDRPSGADSRRALKLFGIAVTTFEDRSHELLVRSRAQPSAEERDAIRSEAAELTAALHRALQEIQGHLYQLQSDFLMELVVREGTGATPPDQAGAAGG